MFPQQWSSPCGTQCTSKYAALMQIPWRVFCKKGCDSDGETWEECLGECNEICYKDPVLKDQQWSAYIDRSPGADNYSVECFHACVAGCGYKSSSPSLMSRDISLLVLGNVCTPGKQKGALFSIPPETVTRVHPNRSPKPCIVRKPPQSPIEPITTAEDVPCTSA